MPLSRITSASIANSAVAAADIADGTITAAKIVSIANTQITGTLSVANTSITGNIISSQITSVANTQITGNIISSQITSNPTLYGNVSVTGVIAVGGATTSTSGSGISFHHLNQHHLTQTRWMIMRRGLGRLFWLLQGTHLH